MKKNERLIGLDLLKVIAIIFVIGAHVPLFNSDFFNGGSMVQYFLVLLSEGVPLFLTINGFLLFRKKDLDIRKHYRKTFAVWGLFVVWSLILIVVNLLFDKTPIDRHIIIDLFLKTGQDGDLYTAELWFLQYLIPLYIVYPMLWMVYRRDEKLFNIIFGFAAFFTVVLNMIPILVELLGNPIRAGIIMNFHRYLLKSSFLGLNGNYVFNFMLGGMISRYYKKLMEKRWLFAGAGVLAWAMAMGLGYLISFKIGSLYNEHFNNNTIFMPFMVIAWFALLSNIEIKGVLSNAISQVGSRTLGIYVIHSFVIRIVRLFIPSTVFGTRLLIVLAVLALSWVFTFAVSKIPGLKHLVSF